MKLDYFDSIKISNKRLFPIIVLFILNTFFLCVNSHTPCKNHLLKKPKRVLNHFTNEENRLVSDHTNSDEKYEWKPININFDFTHLNETLSSPEDVSILKNQILSKTKDIFKKLLRIKKKTSNRLIISKK